MLLFPLLASNPTIPLGVVQALFKELVHLPLLFSFHSREGDLCTHTWAYINTEHMWLKQSSTSRTEEFSSFLAAHMDWT